MRRRRARGKDFRRGLGADWAELPGRAASYETGESLVELLAEPRWDQTV